MEEDSNLVHIPVMGEEVVEAFHEVKMTAFFDGTLGMGGHAKLILEDHPELKLYVGCDRDEIALELARESLTEHREKLRTCHGEHKDLAVFLDRLGVGTVQGFFLT